MPKVRCGGCKAYVNRENIYRKNGVTAVCSQKCLLELRNPTRKQAKLQTPKPKAGSISPAMHAEILARDRHECRFCGTNRNLEVHHINYRSSGGPGENWNLITLCSKHHAVIHADKKVYLPLCLGVVWMTYMGPYKQITVPQMKRWVAAQQ